MGNLTFQTSKASVSRTGPGRVKQGLREAIERSAAGVPLPAARASFARLCSGRGLSALFALTSALAPLPLSLGLLGSSSRRPRLSWSLALRRHSHDRQRPHALLAGRDHHSASQSLSASTSLCPDVDSERIQNPTCTIRIHRIWTRG